MASQILTEVHANEPLKLESCIQDCPAGIKHNNFFSNLFKDFTKAFINIWSF